MGHRAATAEIVEQATLALAEFGRRDLVGKMHVPGTAGLREAAEKCLRTLEVIERQVAAAPGRQCNDDLRHPVGMCRAARHVDHRQSRLGTIALPEKTAVFAFEE